MPRCKWVTEPKPFLLNQHLQRQREREKLKITITCRQNVSLLNLSITVSPIPVQIRKSYRRFDRVAPVFFRAKTVRSGNVSFLCLCAVPSAITVRAQSVSGCRTCSVGRVLSSQGSHPATRELKPCVPVEVFLSWGHLDVDGFLEQQLPGVPGHINHCGLFPNHTNCCLDFQSHHPAHVKRGLVRSLYDRAQAIASTQDNMQNEEHHLSKVLRSNGDPGAFIHSAARPPQREVGPQVLPPERSRPPLVVLPYTAGVSEGSRRQ